MQLFTCIGNTRPGLGYSFGYGVSAALLCVAAGLALGALPIVSLAQTQDGTLLQRDLMRVKTGPGQPLVNSRSAALPARNIAQEVQLRNAVVTGNAPGGRSFRGEVGYTAPDDFRGRLGSDDNFAFRRDSIPAGAAGLGFRGTESLQYQFSFTSGTSRNEFISRDGSPSKSSTSGPGSGVGATGPLSNRALDTSGYLTRQTTGQGAWSISASGLGTLRSVGAFQSSRMLTPSVVGYRSTFAGLERTSASSLLGVRSVLLGQSPTAALNSARSQVPTTGPASSAIASTSAAIATPSLTGPGLAELPNLENRGAIDRVGDSVRRVIRSAVKPVQELKPNSLPNATAGTDLAKPDLTLPDLTLPDLTRPDLTRPDLTQPDATNLAAAVEPAAVVEVDAYDARMAELRKLLDPAARRGKAAPLGKSERFMSPEEKRQAAIGKGQLAGVDQELLDIIRDSKILTSTLVMDPKSDEAISAQLIVGQRMLGQSRFFDAEEQFARVLSFRPADTGALVGRAHAQLGGGLLLSSALNLRELFANYPEAMAVRYESPAIPDRERLRVLVDRLRANLDKGAALAESALLLAYVGHQLDDIQARREGLEAMRAVDLTDPLPDVLERIWSLPDPSLSIPAPALTPSPVVESAVPVAPVNTQPAPSSVP